MIITCEKCSTRFTLDDALINPTGSKVRCSHCKHIFTAFPAVPETMEPDFETPEDLEFEEPDFSESDEDSFDDPGFEQETTVDFSPSDTPDIDDQDIEFDEIEFDEIEFDEEPDFNGSDFSDTEPQAMEIGLEMDSTDDISGLDIEDALPEQDGQDPDIAFEDSDLEFGDDDLELDSQELEFEDIELLEDDGEKSDDHVNRLESEENSLELENISLEMDDLQEDESELEEIEFETEEDVDLELVFDDDPDADLVFEEAAEDYEDLDSSRKSDDAFDAPSQLTQADEFEPELELEEELDFIIEEDLSDTRDQAVLDSNDSLESPDSQKFTDYDAVLDQDPEPLDASAEQDDDFEPEPDLEIPEDKLPEVDEKIADPAEELLIGAPSAADARKKRAKKSAGRIGAPVKIFFLLFLLVIAAYVASLKLGADIPYLSNINIPFITDALKPAPLPKPPLKPVPNEASINGRFISNTTSGELFIVTGRIENPSTIAYSHIKVRGTLLAKDKTKSGTQTAYCGNIISEEILKTGNISDITKQLGVQKGIQDTNVNIKPDGSVQFMLVFSNLPDNLTNFTVEVVDFQALAGKK